MIDLTTLLNTRTHRDLELLARAHGLPFTRREPKAVGLAKLAGSLDDAYTRAFATLDEGHIAALQALVAAGGWLPLPQFTAHFGDIRPYKPWRSDFAPRHPWRYPVSVAERLYHLGYIVIREGEMVGIIAEITEMLPALPQPQPEAATGLDFMAFQDRSALVRDVAALLGVLLRMDVVPVHGRWLPLGVLRVLNPYLAVPEDLSAVRSELQAGRVRWLHYLAVVAGLVDLQNGMLKPTVGAWDWLDAPAQAQYEALMAAIAADLAAPDRAWDVFRFPAVSMGSWCVLCGVIEALGSNQVYHLRQIMAALAPYLLPEHPATLAYLVRDMLAWSGILTLYRGRVALLPGQFQAAKITTPPDRLHFRLPSAASAALVTLLSFAEIHAGWAQVNEAAVVKAVERGLTLADVSGVLQSLHDAPLDSATRAQLAAWFNTATALTLGNVVILQTQDPALVARIRSDWRLAGYFSARLSPQHLAVPADKAEGLLNRLRRRGYTVTSLLAHKKAQQATETLNPTMADYLLLAVRSYQGMQAHLDADVRIPKAITHWLSDRSTDPAAVEGQAQQVVRSVQGQVASAVEDHTVRDAAGIRQWVEAAHQRGQPLTIDYYSAYYDGATTRTLTVEDLFDADDLTYIEAYCHRAERVLTFRLDRIQAVHPTPPTDVMAG